MHNGKTEGQMFIAVSYLLGAGSIIEPGNWGRILKINSKDPKNPDAAKMMAYEEIFESVRVELAPSAPSRLECAFVTPSLTAANMLKKERRLDVLYECELVSPDLSFFPTDWRLFDWRNQLSDSNEAKKARARRYWGFQGEEHTEALTMSSVRIVRRVQ